MTAKAGRSRTFPPCVVPIALVERERTGRTWIDIAGDLDVNPATLRARVSDYRRQSALQETLGVRSRRP